MQLEVYDLTFDEQLSLLSFDTTRMNELNAALEK